jgi:metal transporter CNNM
MNILIWIGIGFCVSQSAMFSGLNLAFFSISKLRLEIESKNNNNHALKILKMREDSNFLLTTILWGNVGINVLLTLLSNSVMAGVTAFIFSTFIITFLGEIIPQAYFSRHAIRTASFLSPILRLYQLLLYPAAKPSAFVLDKWLGSEAVQFFQEKDLRELLKIHLEAPQTDIEKVEGKGAMNFLAIDDLSIVEEGEIIDPKSIIELPFIDSKPIFPDITSSCDDAFLNKIQDSGKKWVILTDASFEPKLTLDSDAFLRSALFKQTEFNPLQFCHRPIIIKDSKTSLGAVMSRLKVYPERISDDVIDEDIILFWGDEKRVITGSDVLGRLLRGIAYRENTHYRTFYSINE